MLFGFIENHNRDVINFGIEGIDLMLSVVLRVSNLISKLKSNKQIFFTPFSPTHEQHSIIKSSLTP
jgi:hypothetical protein